MSRNPAEVRRLELDMTEKSGRGESQAPQSLKPTSAPPFAVTKLIPVTRWNEIHPWPPTGGLRHLIFHAGTNGFNRVIRRIGRRVLIDEAAFFQWADAQQGDVS